ncbi:MAG: carbamoylphosphate synthase large subunit [Bacilli bacterium]|nr:carbamoylphosphate synthase large subunit [Bacilli bacterium]
MNFIFISPNFPVRYFKWVEALRDHGVTVLGILDTPEWNMHPRLKSALTEYYYVSDLSDYRQMLDACYYFQNKYGRIDFIESDNEWWLTQDARLRKELGVHSGFYPEEMLPIKAKSEMKAKFRQGGAKTMRYTLVDGPEDIQKAFDFIKEVGYPVFVKPNVGVGASDSYALHNDEEVKNFLSKRLAETYIMEEYINGYIVSFDGICDDDSNVVFCTSDHFPTPIDQVVNEVTDFCYFNNPFSLTFYDMDGKEFEKVGRQVVKAFNIKKRFFHIEFFVLKEDKPGFAKKGEFVALECNMRPAGGNTPDLIDYANSVSVYQIYADVICYNENRQNMDLPKYYAFASARRDSINYLHDKSEIFEKYAHNLCMAGRYPDHIAVAMGDEYYYAKFEKYEDGVEFDNFIRAKRK